MGVRIRLSATRETRRNTETTCDRETGWVGDRGKVAVIGPVVKTESVDQGRAIQARGVERIEAAIDAGWLVVLRPTATEQRHMQRILQMSRLGDGEAESLSLASARGLTAVLDDKEARAVAETLGIDYLGTAAVLLEGFLRRRLSLEELEAAVRDLSEITWLAPAVVAEILRRAREAERSP